MKKLIHMLQKTGRPDSQPKRTARTPDKHDGFDFAEIADRPVTMPSIEKQVRLCELDMIELAKHAVENVRAVEPTGTVCFLRKPVMEDLRCPTAQSSQCTNLPFRCRGGP